MTNSGTVFVTRRVEVMPAEMKIYLKVRDEFSFKIVDTLGNTLCEQDDGYVPAFMPGEHYGDYVDLVIDVQTGHIKNWPTNAEFIKRLQIWLIDNEPT